MKPSIGAHAFLRLALVALGVIAIVAVFVRGHHGAAIAGAIFLLSAGVFDLWTRRIRDADDDPGTRR